MELFLRTAYGLPLHDVEREKDVVRERLRGVEARMVAAGPAGVGPGHYAMGRGYLALQEPDLALAHLKQAIAAGYASPELDYAMGLALGERYDRAVVEAKRIDDAERQKARLAELSAEYAAPAARHLRAALAARLEAPAYVEGLIALREGRPEEALEKARAAFEKAPWLEEAKRLEGDAHFAMGRRFGADAAFDYDRMMVDYRAAAEAYRAAAEIARSDPQVHEAACRLWAQIMLASSARPETLRPSHEEAAAACGRAIAASSRSVSARIAWGFVQSQYAWQLVAGSVAEDPEPAIDEAIALGTEAARLAPGDPMAPYVVAAAERARALGLYDRGLDCRGASDRAIAAFQEALRLDPAFVWAHNDLAGAYLTRAAAEGFRGLDPTRYYELAVEQSRSAAALDPHSVREHAIAAAALFLLAEHLVDAGRDPAAPIARARIEVEAGRALAPDWADAWVDSRDPRLDGGALRACRWPRPGGGAGARRSNRDRGGPSLTRRGRRARDARPARPPPRAGPVRGRRRPRPRARCRPRVVPARPEGRAGERAPPRLGRARRDPEAALGRAGRRGGRCRGRGRREPLLALVATPQVDPRPAEALAEIQRDRGRLAGGAGPARGPRHRGGVGARPRGARAEPAHGAGLRREGRAAPFEGARREGLRPSAAPPPGRRWRRSPRR